MTLGFKERASEFFFLSFFSFLFHRSVVETATIIIIIGAKAHPNAPLSK